MKWRTKDGRVIRLSEMTDSHLLNSLAMLRRKIANDPGYIDTGVEDFDLEGSFEVFLINSRNEKVRKSVNRAIKGLEREVKRRTLTP